MSLAVAHKQVDVSVQIEMKVGQSGTRKDKIKKALKARTFPRSRVEEEERVGLNKVWTLRGLQVVSVRPCIIAIACASLVLWILFGWASLWPSWGFFGHQINLNLNFVDC